MTQKIRIVFHVSGQNCIQCCHLLDYNSLAVIYSIGRINQNVVLL